VYKNINKLEEVNWREVITEMLYEKKIEEILAVKETKETENEQLKATTLFLPQILRLGLAELKEKKRTSLQKVTKSVIEHGHSIIQKKHSETIREIAEIKSQIRFASLKPLRNFNETKITIDAMESPMKRYIKLSERILASIRELSGILSIEQSSFIRLCMFYSLNTSENLNEEIKEISRTEIRSFEERLEEIRFLYQMMKEAEEKWNKRLQEQKGGM